MAWFLPIIANLVQSRCNRGTIFIASRIRSRLQETGLMHLRHFDIVRHNSLSSRMLPAKTVSSLLTLPSVLAKRSGLLWLKHRDL